MLENPLKCPAGEMYQESQLFKKATQYINQLVYDDWFIISAKYGLLSKDTIIEPYDLTLNNMNSLQRKEWAKDVYEQLIKINPKVVDFYAGKKYREYLDFVPPHGICRDL
ncbi:hypothetical protein J2Y03_004794 [Neobacillus niacini]|uniref:DUF6884 domain-containing protein n=1 Tax=Neobacillus niacini TaxID=86668 RepID=UPI002861F7C1|nr:DUF6884 domain-containing protein [Neobacillus niacini]MDR7079736.1 hypothetical protein [Neobacillus niacini]